METETEAGLRARNFIELTGQSPRPSRFTPSPNLTLATCICIFMHATVSTTDDGPRAGQGSSEESKRWKTSKNLRSSFLLLIVSHIELDSDREQYQQGRKEGRKSKIWASFDERGSTLIFSQHTSKPTLTQSIKSIMFSQAARASSRFVVSSPLWNSP